MIPYFFGPSDDPLFGVYTPPRASVARGAAVLLVSPLGIAYQRTHYALRLVAQQLGDAGLHVLRFDFHGMGDSSGNIGAEQFDRWLDDIELATNELIDASGTSDISIVGLQMGAVLAIEAMLNRKIKIKSLVLWDPVVSGTDYLATLQSIQQDLLAGRRELPGYSDELLGAHFPPDLRNHIGSIQLAERTLMPSADRAALVVSDDLPRYGALLKKMQSHWPDLTYRLVDAPVKWESLASAYEGRMTGPIIRAVAETTGSLA
jgi:pimeloyl-ACP methyl ester carboxylesterase